MGSLATSLALGLGQMFDGAVLRIVLKSLVVTIVIFVIVITLAWFAIDRLLEAGGVGEILFAGAGGLRGVLALVLAAIGLWLTWRVVAMAVMQFFADEVVMAIERKHYPAEATMAREPSFAEQLGNGIGSALRALTINLIAAPFALLLLFTGIGTAALFWLVNAVVLGRELQDMVWLRHRRRDGSTAPLGLGQRFGLGGVTAALLAVPVVNLLAPVLGAACATHLVHRTNRKARLT
ncbi:EI24 domain-containing protein [Aurantiacibacter spongiae]|uniref:EI24 domain-containing protein n=1 Tax=Aurantiacibacter spongiae TaxID=2488860 RepID=A0A3N5CXQ9_9SPHN|nr:EI24 domain-containing protein [Aurantiacibacter spongiae]RPF71439.1 hypothetical protein EG799_07290 [Aurantiacibacter spongiae]